MGGAELFNALSQEERERWQKKYSEDLRAYDAWAFSDEGRAAMNRLKEKRAEKKAAADAAKNCAEEIVTTGPAKGWKVTVWLKQVGDNCKKRKFCNTICWDIVSPLACH